MDMLCTTEAWKIRYGSTTDDDADPVGPSSTVISSGRNEDEAAEIGLALP